MASRPDTAGNSNRLSSQQITWEGFAKDAVVALSGAAGAVFLVTACEMLIRAGVLTQEVGRKVVHLLAGPSFLLLWPLFSEAPHARVVAAFIPALHLSRLLFIGLGCIKEEAAVSVLSRDEDRRQLLGGRSSCIIYVLVLLAVTLLCWRQSLVGIVVVAFMCGGDGMADLIGRHFGGSLKLPHNKNKSWAGSMAMFLGGAGMAMGMIAYSTACGMTHCRLWEIAGPVSGIAATAAFAESLPVNRWLLDDNLTVPIVTACLSHILFGQKRQHTAG